MEGLFLLKEVLQKGGLYVQNRSQGCLFFSASGTSKICKVSMEGSVVPVPMSMVWFGSSTKDIYETTPDSGHSFEMLMVRLLLFLDDVLLMSASIEELTF